MIDRIVPGARDGGAPASSLEETAVVYRQKKRGFVKGFVSLAGLAVGSALAFAVIVLATMDVEVVSFKQIATLGLDFFLLFICTYNMYVTAADSGMRAGLKSQIYASSIANFHDRKDRIIQRNQLVRLHDFCAFWIEDELKCARSAVLAVSGISYHLYQTDWLGKDKSEIKKARSLTKLQRKTIIKANKLRPVRLTPEMIVHRGAAPRRRSPLGLCPERKKRIHYSVRFVSTLILSATMSIIILQATAKPTWAVIAECVMKLLVVVLNAFYGFKFGFENIVFDTVSYADNQTALMDQALQFFDEKSGTN